MYYVPFDEVWAAQAEREALVKRLMLERAAVRFAKADALSRDAGPVPAGLFARATARFRSAAWAQPS
jgi:hypothetical protein